MHFFAFMACLLMSIPVTAGPESLQAKEPGIPMTQYMTEIQKQNPDPGSDTLVILWTSGDPEVALNMVFMYAFNAKAHGWWKEITLVVWGPSAKLAAENEKIRKGLKELHDSGIKLEACKACSDEYGVSARLVELGIAVRYMGEPLTGYLKSGARVITF